MQTNEPSSAPFIHSATIQSEHKTSSIKNFKRLSPRYQALTIVVTGLAGLFLIVPGIFAFRALTSKLPKVKVINVVSGDNNLTQRLHTKSCKTIFANKHNTSIHEEIPKDAEDKAKTLTEQNSCLSLTPPDARDTQQPSSVVIPSPSIVENNGKVAEEPEIPHITPVEVTASHKIENPSTLTINEQFLAIKNSYKHDVNEELQRLRDKGILTPLVEKALETQWNLLRVDKTRVKLEESKMYFSRTLELREVVKDSHHLLVHAQDTRWVVISYLIKELMREEYSKEALKDFKFMRYPEEQLADLAELTSDPEVHDHEARFRKELISCDAFLFSAEDGESAAHWFVKNDSIASAQKLSAIETCAVEIIKKALPNDSEAQDRLIKTMKEVIEKTRANRMGSLQVILIPKETAQDYVYKSHPFGKPCDCKPIKGMSDAELLASLQESTQIPREHQCTVDKTQGRGKAPPQYRILASHLRPGKGIYIKTLTPIDKKLRKEIKVAINKAKHP